MDRAQLFRQRPLVLAARDRHRFETHLRGKLNTEMTKSADPEHSNKITTARAAVAQRIKRRDTGAHEWRAFDRRQIFRHQRQRRRGSEHILGVTAVERNPGSEQSHLAGKEIAPPARIAVSAMSSVPAHANSLTRFPSRD